MPHRSVRRKVQILAAMMPLATCSLFGLLSLSAQALAKSKPATAHEATPDAGVPPRPLSSDACSPVRATSFTSPCRAESPKPST